MMRQFDICKITRVEVNGLDGKDIGVDEALDAAYAAESEEVVSEFFLCEVADEPTVLSTWLYIEIASEVVVNLARQFPALLTDETADALASIVKQSLCDRF